MNQEKLEQILEALDYAERVLSRDTDRPSRMNIATLAKEASAVVRAELSKFKDPHA